MGKSHIYTLTNAAKASNGKLAIGVTTGKNTTVVDVEVNGISLGKIQIKPSDSYDFGYETERVFDVQGLQNVDSVRISTVSGGPARLDYLSMTYDTPRPAPRLGSGSFAVPEYVHNITNQDLHAHDNVDMVIVIPTSQKWLQEARRLAAFHEQHDSISVRIVPADELYNEFKRYARCNGISPLHEDDVRQSIYREGIAEVAPLVRRLCVGQPYADPRLSPAQSK